jgi:hypothetical protein
MAADTMFHCEFPKLVSHFSNKVEGFKRDYRISNVVHAGGKNVMEPLSKLDCSVDVCDDGQQGFFINGPGYEGQPLNDKRFKQYHSAMQGVFGTDWKKRRELFEATQGMCHVRQLPKVNGEIEWMCDCVRFWKDTTCPHAYLIKYKQDALSGAVLFNSTRNNGNTKPKAKVKQFLQKEINPETMVYTWEESGFNITPGLGTLRGGHVGAA